MKEQRNNLYYLKLRDFNKDSFSHETNGRLEIHIEMNDERISLVDESKKRIEWDELNDNDKDLVSYYFSLNLLENTLERIYKVDEVANNLGWVVVKDVSHNEALRFTFQIITPNGLDSQIQFFIDDECYSPNEIVEIICDKLTEVKDSDIKDEIEYYIDLINHNLIQWDGECNEEIIEKEIIYRNKKLEQFGY